MSKKRRRRGGGGVPRQFRLGSLPATGPAVNEAFSIREDQRAEPVVVHGESTPEDSIEMGDGLTLEIPTVGLRSMVAVARVDALERVLDEATEGNLSSRGRHLLTDMRRVFNQDGSDFVRARSLLQLKDRPAGTPYEVYLDFPTRYVGMLLDASVRREDVPEEKGPSHPQYTWKVRQPRWVGSHAFARVWEHAERVSVESYKQARGSDRIDSRGLMSMASLSMMADARLIRVEPEQVQVLPDWEEFSYLWDYAQDVVLPAERVFLDFEGPGGFAPMHDLESGPFAAKLRNAGGKRLSLRGALVWRSEGRLCMTIVGWPEEWQWNLRQAGQTIPWNDYDPVGTVVFGDGSPYEAVLEEVGEMTIRLGDSEVYSRPLGISTRKITEEELGGYVQIPLGKDDLATILPRLTDEALVAKLRSADGIEELVGGWAVMVLSCAARAMAALSILEADEVELIDAPVHKRELDRAKKRGWKVAQVVWIRPPKKYLNGNAPTGDEARYSHRFWVRAHTKHFTIGTRVADSRPDLVRACHRCGTCRRVPTKAFIKGPPDKPLVPKSLAVKKDRPREVQLPRREDERPYYDAPTVV